MDTFEICRLIREAPKELLSSTERLLLLTMAIIGNKQGKNINPGIKWLAEYTNLSKMSIIRSLASLMGKKVLILLPGREKGSHEHSCYELNIELLQNIRNNRSHANKSYTNKSNILVKYENKDGNYPQSLPEIIQRSSNTVLPDNHENSPDLVTLCYQTGNTVLPEPSNTVLPLPYTPIFKTNNDHCDHVELPLDEPSTPVEKKSKKSSKQINSWTPQVMEVFEHWQVVLNHPRSKLDEHRRKYIVKVLESGFSVDDLKLAIDGVKKTPHNMGDNDRKKVFDDFDVIFRNSKQVERFIRNFDIPEAPIKNNATTGLKLTFVERNKSRVNMMRRIGDKYFPELSSNPLVNGSKESSITLKQERVINEHE